MIKLRARWARELIINTLRVLSDFFNASSLHFAEVLIIGEHIVKLYQAKMIFSCQK